MPLDLHRDIGGGARIRAGIEFNGAGQRTACWVMRDRPGDPLTSLRLEPLRLPATDCLHLFKPLAAGQLRGITWLAPVLLRLRELDQFEDAALVKAKVAALFTGFITDPYGTAGGPTGTNTNGALTVGMEPGSLIPLPPGTDIRFSNPTESDAYGPFVKTRPAYIEADLVQIFANEDAASFAVLWLLIHRTRFGVTGSPATDCALERWRDAGSKEGEVARDRLAVQVQIALKVLGSGFLEANPDLRDKLKSGEITVAQTLRRGNTYWIGIRHSSNAILSAWASTATPDLNGGAPVTTARKVLRRTLAYATAAPSTWGYLASETNAGPGTAIWLRAA